LSGAAIRGDFSAGTKAINSAGNMRLGNATFQASATILVASANDFGGDCGNCLSLALFGDSAAVAKEDIFGFLAICWDCDAVRFLRERLLLSGSESSQSDWWIYGCNGIRV
jgi:hypothetical protein